MNQLDWENLTKVDKKKLFADRPVLILGMRDVSVNRIKQLDKKLKAQLKGQELVWGALEEEFVAGLEDSPQFASLTLTKLTDALPSNSTLLSYPQRYAHYLLKEIDWSAIIGVYGSWHRAFHFTDLYRVITQKKLQYKLVSSFVDQGEAKSYLKQILPQLPKVKMPKIRKADSTSKKRSDQELMELVELAAHRSFDYTFQTGAVLAKDGQLLLSAHNRVLPYETYILHRGASKEKQFSPPQDLNHFDTNHAEVELVIKALEQGVSLAGTSLYINLLPCPICARMLARSKIAEIVYRHDHSQGYGFRLLRASGKKVRRVN
ncbi:MAG: hypothetical protein GF381_02715 [Candidatus Pacebacteria bacterium]|nr:hypothetical protein [Candidatus Paceibacterota bacterium]